MQAKEHWIFYLKLSKELPKEYILLDNHFKKSNKSLIPVSLKALLDCVRKSKSVHIMIVVRTAGELKFFNKHIKKIVKYLVRTGKVNLYIASSFNAVNDPSIMRRDYYNFAKLPISMDYLCGSISKMVDIKESQIHAWPGGAAPKMSLSG